MRLRKLARDIAVEHYNAVHKKKEGFVAGESYINYGGRVYDSKEIAALLDSSLDFWLTTGRFAKKFESGFAKFFGVNHCSLANSGSSANLLAVSALTSPKLGERRLRAGDEVITTACGFPTTVAPIVQNNLTPVFLDVELGTYNVRASDVEAAVTKKTKAVFLAHTLGNPFDLEAVLSVAKKHELLVIEDSCDALGAKYGGKYAGTFGDLSTFSFYPAHHITMGEGGAVCTNDGKLRVLVESFRDWGRDCWCPPGADNSCKKRFGWQLGSLPFGYDHKYTYSHLGFNLKVTDMQAAVGCAQLEKLPSFIAARKRNWKLLYEGLRKHKKYFILPEATKGSEPSWFGFVLSVREGAPFSRNDIVKHLEGNRIATRLLFAGNITRQPCFEGLDYRVAGTLKNTDYVMNNAFWVGVYPALTREMIDYVVGKFDEFLN